MTVPCVVFEDGLAENLRPINLARPTCGVTCGAYCLQDLLASWPSPVHFHVRTHLREIMARAGYPLVTQLEGPTLYINAALVPDIDVMNTIMEFTEKGEPFLAVNDQQVCAALSPNGFPEDLAEQPGSVLAGHLLNQRLPILDNEFPILTHTFDVLTGHERLLEAHLQHQIQHQRLTEIQPNVFAGADPKIAPNVVIDTSDGPVVLGDNVSLNAFSYIAGPVRLGHRSRVIDHASIKHGTVLGHTVKAGGEIEGTIIEPYSNKQHHGFLGHGYVGSWVNLGAGTSNSDLKNTYGEIHVEINGQSVPSGRQFVGCVIGDYTKTAINTSIFTGKLIGVASFVYGFVSTNVPSFTNYARSFGQVTEVGVDVAIKTQARASQRRKVETTEVDARLMRDLYELTRTERQLSSEQVVL